MTLSAREIMALLSLPGIGRQSVFKAAAVCQESADAADIAECLAQAGIAMRTKAGRESITAEDLRTALEQADDCLYRSAQKGIRALGFWDKAFPPRLKKTCNEEGKPDVPVLLFYRGNAGILDKDMLAVIGSHESGEAARRAGTYLAGMFAERGFGIVSGLALGCDAAAHEGALRVPGGVTAAFLGHGMDTVYPAKHHELAERIVEAGGVLLSEYPIGTRVSRFRLVERDRLQAGLAMGTLVIQTKTDGGTMHAAKATAASGKPLFAVRFSDPVMRQSELSAGNRLLVEQFGASWIEGLPDRKAMAQQIDEYAAKLREADQKARLAECNAELPF